MKNLSFNFLFRIIQMRIYETPEGVDQYFQMSEGYDLSHYKKHLFKYLPEGKSLLEIGMGPGNDFAWLKDHYKITGSDYSNEFISRAMKRFPDADLMVLDGISLNTDRKFDALFSSKVYQHIPLDRLKGALDSQYRILNRGGVIFHTFWIGGREMKIEDMVFYYHDIETLLKLIGKNFEILETDQYTEFEENDSLFVIARKK